jgi:hypothetical protein
MISEHTAMHTRSLTPVSADGMALTTTRSAAFRKRAGTVAGRALIMATALLRALVTYGNPPYFQLEQKGPVQQRLGPGLCRESDAFWPISQW